MDEQAQPDYAATLAAFRGVVLEAVQLHSGVRSLRLQGVAPRACLMFARLMLISCSLLRLCPESIEAELLWDFTSIALLARSLFEAVLFFRYFVEPSSASEWVARMIVIDLHDRAERVRLFKRLQKGEDVKGFEAEVEVLRDVIRKNEFFKTLDLRRQSEILNCSRASILTLSEMVERFSPEPETWAVFQFLSHYTHSHPVSFLRNDERRRDGLSNEVDGMYLPLLLERITPALSGAIMAYARVPSGVCKHGSDRASAS